MFGLIILGSKPVEKQLGSGWFSCPTCRSEASYHHSEVRQYFTLFFLPIFPLGASSELVRCDRCGSEFSHDILRAGREVDQGTHEPWRCRHCGNANPWDHSRCVACKQPRDV